MKKLIVKLGLKFNLQKMPYWMILLLLLCSMLALYAFYEETRHLNNAYQDCSDCSR